MSGNNATTAGSEIANCQTGNERNCSMRALGNTTTKLKLILVFSNLVKFNKVEIFTSAEERKRRN
jgi:hypothetical protein